MNKTVLLTFLYKHDFSLPILYVQLQIHNKLGQISNNNCLLVLMTHSFYGLLESISQWHCGLHGQDNTLDIMGV